MNKEVNKKWKELIDDYKYFLEYSFSSPFFSKGKRKGLEIKSFISAVECYDKKLAKKMNEEFEPLEHEFYGLPYEKK